MRRYAAASSFTVPAQRSTSGAHLVIIGAITGPTPIMPTIVPTNTVPPIIKPPTTIMASKIIRSAKNNIVLIDNYVDESTLTHLAKKKKGVQVFVLTKTISKQLQLDLKKANEQYGNFEANTFTQSHDRFLITDGKEVYHLGASLKDLGKKWFAFSKLEPKSVENIMNEIKELI